MRQSLNRESVPAALTIAGSDSGGGAGIQADLKTFAALRVHGASAITCVTAQNPTRVVSIQPVRPEIVRDQIEAIFAELPPRAIKTGMLYSRAIILAVAEALQGHVRRPLIVDPVMISSSGLKLLRAGTLKTLEAKLLAIATLVTPNVPEAEALTGFQIREPEDMRRAARLIVERHGCAALIKGGHLPGASEALDLFYDGKNELLLSAPMIPQLKTHGTGCTYSAALAAYMALGFDLTRAVTRAKQFMIEALDGRFEIGGHQVLNCFTRKRRRNRPE